MVDSEMALTFSIRNNPGVYALLLGSGVSTGAGIPTGWGVLQDLTQQMASIESADPDDPIEWYTDRYGEQPRYRDILEELAHSREERRSLLEPYFEPTEEEREHGEKVPSDAHNSIAWLVDEGYIDVIVTTNFDRLLEQALEERGVTPTRISSAAAAKGATPLRHEDAVILKINGDYKETNIKNTSTELDKYDPAIRQLLDQVFAEYGLIVCGWSAKHDTALRNAMLECESRRYSTFWTYRSGLEDEAEEFVEHRDAVELQIEGASQFFSELKENVQALEEAEEGAPLTREIARKRVERYLPREARKIDLSNLIQDETERVRDRVFDETRFPLDADFAGEAIEDRLDGYAAAMETLVVTCSTCAYWNSESAIPVSEYLSEAIRRMGTIPRQEGTAKRGWKKLRHYPGTVLLYGVGVPAVASEDWKLVYDMLVGTEITVVPWSGGSVTKPAIVALHPSRCAEAIPSDSLRSETNIVKNRVKGCVRGPMRDFMPDDSRFEEEFFRFDAVADMVLFDRCREVPTCKPVVPDSPRHGDVLESIAEEVAGERDEWAPLQTGLFEGSMDRLDTVLDEFQF